MSREFGALIVAMLLLSVGRAASCEDIAAVVDDLTHPNWERSYPADLTIRRLADERAAILQSDLIGLAVIQVHRFDRLLHTESTVRLLQHIVDCGYEFTPALPATIAALNSQSDGVLCESIPLVGSFGPTAKAAVPRLRKILETEDSSRCFVCIPAASALSRIDPSNAEYVDRLIRWLSAENPFQRWLAADGLGRIGPTANRAETALAASLEDEHSTVRAFAAIALWKINHQSNLVLPTLIRALDEPGAPCHKKPIQSLSMWAPSHNMKVAEFLGEMQGAALNAVPALVARFDRADENDGDTRILRGRILRALNRIAPDDPRVVDVMRAVLTGPDGYLKSIAQQIDREMQKSAPGV